MKIEFQGISDSGGVPEHASPSLSLQTTRAINLCQPAIKGTERQMPRFPRDFERQTIRKARSRTPSMRVAHKNESPPGPAGQWLIQCLIEQNDRVER
jgi:hypothetical protein